MTRRRLPPPERRQQIVEAARAVIVRRGLAATSLRDIAAEAKVSMGTVTYHFSGVDEILGEVAVLESESFYTHVVAAADAEPDPWRALRLLVDPLFGDTPDVRAHWRIWSDYWAAVGRRSSERARAEARETASAAADTDRITESDGGAELMAHAYADRIRYWENCCARVIARGVESGTFRQVDARDGALKLAAYADGLGAQRLQRARGLTAAVAHAWMTEFIERLLSPEPT